MSTLKERFAEKFTPELLIEMSHRWKYGEAQAEVLSFIQAELLLLAEEVNREAFDTKHAVIIIRSKAAELN